MSFKQATTHNTVDHEDMVQIPSKVEFVGFFPNKQGLAQK